MLVVIVLSAVALIAGAVAILMAAQDFRNGTTFRASTAVAIYLGWSCHAAALAAAVLLDRYRVDVAPFPAGAIGALLIGAGIALFVLGIERFQSFGQVTGTEVGSLVTSGVYSFSRNPQYAGWILVPIGVAVAARSPVSLILALAVVVAMRIWIPHEERHLEEQFGEDYRRYQEGVPRFLGFSRDAPPAV